MKKKFDIITLRLGQLQTNCYIVSDRKTKDAIIIDPADSGSYIAEKLTSLSLVPRAIFLTHGHFDHVLGAYELQHIFYIPCYMNSNDSFLLDNMNKSASYHLGQHIIDPPPEITHLSEGKMNCCSIPLTILFSSGHTPGGVIIQLDQEDIVFSGDTIFANGYIGRTDLSYSSPLDLHDSIKRILSLPETTVLYPGHGEETTVKKEAQIHALQKDL